MPEPRGAGRSKTTRSPPPSLVRVTSGPAWATVPCSSASVPPASVTDIALVVLSSA
ncbi:hypothetical protein [Isoptericola sp. NPDC055063]